MKTLREKLEEETGPALYRDSEPFMIGKLKRESVLERALDLINGERAEVYGDALEMHKRIAAGWAEILGVEIRPHEVALCMCWLKLARIIETPDHEDSFVDLAAYAALAGEIQSRDPKVG